jgi:hypothetical protein
MRDHSESSESPWTSALQRGDFESAWQISDSVLHQRRVDGIDCSAWPRHEQFIWKGESLDGKRVLVRCYHGLGDTIQFVRFLPQLRARAAHVTLWVQPELIELLGHAKGIDCLLPLHDGSPQVEYDADIELMELPHALRLSCDEIGCEQPYLDIPQHRRERHGPLRVGIIWRSGDWDPHRSISAEHLRPLSRVADVRWFSLQYPPQPLPFAASDMACKRILTMATRMCTLDLVISVDTMGAHLAGALHIPVWTCLPQVADWRWFDHPSITRWYPSMRLIRQPTAGAWGAVVEQLTDLLRDLRHPSATRCIRSAGYRASSG